ncbi:hypothetical protein K432DRAFT_410635 [Lepidopterella palustris CBS 459.81]|uniref:F-box domain-containing protein n=1 Tax=Lepidopterella palustris CBS 459.81 TaxID=1314670 RepID=A0A8E2DXU5_9PEZI|nr:hypothetical protein K432DRAFT_410635 [Lepidopterella palustris CBS 459.81]
MERINTDIWTFDRASILKVTLVCKAWHHIAQRILEGDLDRIIISPGSHVRNVQLFQRIERDPKFQQRTHHIRILDVHSSEFLPFHRDAPWPDYKPGHEREEHGYLERRSDSTWAQLEQLATLIPRLSLSGFIWAAKMRIPQCILDALVRQSDCRVHCPLPAGDPKGRSSAWITFPSIQTLEGLSGLRLVASSLVSLGVVVPAWDDISKEQSLLRLLGKLISEAPLRNLEIHAADRPYPQIAYAPRVDFAILTDFRWMIDFFHTSRDPLRLHTLRLTNMCMCGPDQQTLLHLGEVKLGNCISWKDLRKVHLTCPTLLDFMRTDVGAEEMQLQSLILELDSPYAEIENKACRKKPDFDSVRSFLFSQHSLQHVGLYNGLPVVASGDDETDRDLFCHLSQSLHSLTLHENEPGCNTGQPSRSIISLATLRLIGETCPCLRELAVDIPCKDTELLEYLVCISQSLWFVRSLELLVELEKYNQHTIREPISDIRCLQIWNDLFNSSSRLRLKSLLVRVGAMFSNEKANPLPPTKRWQRRFLVEGDGTSGGQCYGVAKCLELEEFEARLRHDSNSTYGGMTHRELGMFRDIAVKGCRVYKPPAPEPLPELPPGAQWAQINIATMFHPLYQFTGFDPSQIAPPQTQQYRQTRRTKPQRKLRSLLPKE